MIAVVIVVWGAAWTALAFMAVAIFAGLSGPLGVAGAAGVTAAIFLVLAILGGLLISYRMAMARQQNSWLAALASSGAVSAILGVALKRPLLTLGIGGAIAALFARYTSPPSR